MVERGMGVALVLLVSFTSGCPEPVDEAGDDEIGDTATDESTSDSSTTDTSDSDEGEAGRPPSSDDIQAPDDATPETDESGDGDGDGDGDGHHDGDGDGDGDERGDTEGGGECWDLTSADGVVPIVVLDDTTALTDDQLGSCGEFAAPDFSFGFQAPFTGQFVFDTAGSSFDTVLYVDQGECSDDELACSDDFVGLSSRIVLPLVAGELVTVVVDGFDANEVGPFTLTVDEYVPPVCNAIAIQPVLPKIMLGDTSDASNQHAGGCGGQAAPDDMYRFTAPGPGLYRFHTFGSSFDTVLYVWDDCEGPELGCSDDANLELQSEVVVDLAGGEQVWIVVDGVDGSAAGPYQLNVEAL